MGQWETCACSEQLSIVFAFVLTFFAVIC